MSPKLMRTVGAAMMLTPVLCLYVLALRGLFRLYGWTVVWYTLAAAGIVCWLYIGMHLRIRADTKEAGNLLQRLDALKKRGPR